MKTAAEGAFLEAIRTVVLVKDSATQPIIASEHTGAHADWLFDFRALMLQPQWLNRYAEIFWERYAAHYPFQVGAMESAGIALVAAIVMKGVERGTPVNGFFLRKSRKRQGLMKQIEGTLTDEPIILVDDLVNNGNTFSKQLLILKEAGGTVSHLSAILAFHEHSAYAALEEGGVQLASFFTLADLGMPFLKGPKPPANSLELVWKFSAPHPSFHLVVHKSSPALDESHVFFGSDDGTFYALDQKTGDIAWKFKVGAHPKGKGILSSPVVHDGSVYFGAYDGVVYALDCASGAVQWKYEEADWVGSSPALWPEKHLLYIGLEFGLFKRRGGIVALDTQSGKEVWGARHPELTHGSPLVIPKENLVVIGSNDGLLYAYDATTGEERWRARSEGDIKMAPAYDAARRQVIFTSLDGRVYAVGVDDGVAIFAKQTGAGIYSAPCVHGDTVYVASLDKSVYAIDLATGKERWTFLTSGRIFATPMVAAGSLWIGSNDGALYEIDILTGKRIDLFQTSERILTRAVYNEKSGLLYAATVANELYCIKKKGGPSPKM